MNTFWGGTDETDEVICGAGGGGVVEETHDAGNIVPVILCHDMDSYVQH